MDMRHTYERASGAVGDTSMESGDWRSHLQPDSRRRIVNRIMDTLKRHLPFSGLEGLYELETIAVRFEEKIYTAATSQSDYMRKILTMETRSQNPMPNAMQLNSDANSINPSYLVIHSQEMQQVNSQQQKLSISVPSNHIQPGQQLLSQTMQNNICSTGMQGSSTLSSTLPPGTSLPQSTISNVASQNSSLQNIQYISGVQRNSLRNTMGLGVPPTFFSNQNRIPGRQRRKQLFQQQRALSEASSTSLDSTAQTSNTNGGDWQEEVYQKIKAMKDLYLLDLNDLHQKLLGKLHQHDVLPQRLTNEDLSKLRGFKNMLEHFMAFLQTPKHNILANHKDNLSFYEKQIVQIITLNPRKPAATKQPPPPQPILPPPHMHSVKIPQQTHLQVASTGPRKSNATDQPLEHLNPADHFFAPKILFFLECFLMILFLCYINTVLMYVVIT